MTIILSLTLLKIGYTLIHSGIFILLIFSPAYFYLENKGQVLSPNLQYIIIYISIQLIYYYILLKVFIFLWEKLNKKD